MIVLSGTPELFPEIDNVFSPISRQFKRIVIDAFRDVNDTRRCVVAPLTSAGLDPLKVLDFETYRRIDQIHEISGGRPYEINLLCHHMYRRIEEGRAKRMELDLDVLEDVRHHLEHEQVLGQRAIVNAIRAMDDNTLKAMATL